jgi:hypothetical protein
MSMSVPDVYNCSAWRDRSPALSEAKSGTFPGFHALRVFQSGYEDKA